MKIILIGGGKFAGALCSLFGDCHEFIGYVDDVYDEAYVGQVYGLPHLGRSEGLPALRSVCEAAIVSIGSEGDTAPRRVYFDKVIAAGFTPPALIHPTAYISRPSTVAAGCIILPHAFIGPGASIDENTLVSTAAVVEHNTSVGRHVFIGPGSTICGSVSVGDCSFIGAGSTIIQKVVIGEDSLVGAGACVVRNVERSTRVVGVPARPAGRSEA